MTTTAAYGSLAIPIPEPETDHAVSDPLLDTLLSFFKATLNAKAAEAWAVVDPRRTPDVAVPVREVFTHDPEELSFNGNNLPALFLWRSEIQPSRDAGIEWRLRKSVLTLNWVMPAGVQERRRIRKPIFNAFSSVLDLVTYTKCDPSWVAEGDTDPRAADEGSMLLAQIGAVTIHIGAAKEKPLLITPVDGGKSFGPYPRIVVTIEIDEKMEPETSQYVELVGIDGTLVFPANSDNPDPLQVLTFSLAPLFTSITPATGPLAGGTTVTIRGQQFQADTDEDDLTVTLGGLAFTDVVWVDEQTLTAKTPEGAALGLVDLVVTNPSGASVVAANAFTYV